MKIKLAILEKDVNYLNRIVSVFETKYSEKLEIYSFTDLDSALANLDSAKIDVLVAGDVFDIDVSKLPKRCGFAYFVDSPEIESLNDQRAICKFQKGELIYKQILSIYSENASNVSGLKIGDDACQVIAFTSPCGGVGTSSLAAACALRYASKGKKTLYLNLEKFGSSDDFFNAEGQFDMSDIVFALKSKKANLPLKLESCVKQDARGVSFYSQTKLALDMLELNAEDIERLISEIKLNGGYDYVVIDTDFGIDADDLRILRQAHVVAWVSDGSETANTKLARAYSAISIKEQNEESPITSRMVLVYNKFSSKTGKVLADNGLKNIGGIPKYEHANVSQVVGQLSTMDVIDKII